MAKKLGILDAQTVADSQALQDGAVLQSHGIVAGETVSQWTQDWWTWALQSPAATSPMLDSTGDNSLRPFPLSPGPALCR